MEFIEQCVYLLYYLGFWILVVVVLFKECNGHKILLSLSGCCMQHLVEALSEMVEAKEGSWLVEEGRISWGVSGWGVLDNG